MTFDSSPAYSASTDQNIARPEAPPLVLPVIERVGQSHADSPAHSKTKEPQQPMPTLCKLDALLSAWEVDAVAAREAYVSRTSLGPVTGFEKLDRELGGAFSPGVHIVHASRAWVRPPSPSKLPRTAAARRSMSHARCRLWSCCAD